MKRSKIFAVLLAAGLLLCGCQETSQSDDKVEETGAETAVQEVGEIVLFENGEGLYQLVRPDVCSDDVTDTATHGWRLMK